MTLETQIPSARSEPGDRERIQRWQPHALYLAAICAMAFMFLTGPAGNTRTFVLNAVCLPFIVVAVFLRSRYPYLLALLGLGLLALSAGLGAYAAGMISLVTRRRGKKVWLLAVLGSALMAFYSYRIDVADGLPWQQILVDMILEPAVLFIAPLAGLYVRVQQERLQATTAQAVRAELAQAAEAQKAAADERERIARGMHDSIGRVLTLVAMQAGAFEVTTKDPEFAASAAEIGETARSGLAELRAVVRALGQDSRGDDDRADE